MKINIWRAPLNYGKGAEYELIAYYIKSTHFVLPSAVLLNNKFGILREVESPRASSTPDKGLYPVTDFTYEPQKDQYICPQGNAMKSTGKWHNHSDGKSKGKPDVQQSIRLSSNLV